MKMTSELALDFEILAPKVTANTKAMIIENVKAILSINSEIITVDAGKYFVTIKGKKFIARELMEGRMELEGEIETIEFYKPHSNSKD